MNAPLRRVGVVVLVLFGLLFLNLNWVQVYKANAYRTDPHNARTQLTEYQRKRGEIALAGGQTIVAQSVATNDELKYQRNYPLGAEYAPFVGYKPVSGLATGVEQAENDFLSGNAPELFADRVKEIFGNKTSGGNILLTINKAVQDEAYNDILHNRSGVKNAAAVVIDPSSGAVLGLASTPSYDPNPLASHNSDTAQDAYDQLNADEDKPLLDKATQETFSPGSTMKVIDSAAALSSGQYTPQTVIPAGSSYTPIPGGSFTMHNAEASTCPNATISLIQALTVSCNTAFAQLGVHLGSQQIKSMAQAFGFEDDSLSLGRDGHEAGLGVAASHTGDMTDPNGQDDPNFVAQSSIGQLNVQMTPLEGALIAATVANDGHQMRPYLIDKAQAPDLSSAYTASPKVLRTPVNTQVAGDLQQMMESVVAGGTGKKAQIPGFQVGGKTGTAQNSTDDGDHGWFIGFAMKDNQPIAAVCVFLEHAGDSGSGEAARIAGDLMKTVIAQKGIK
ncbi:D,D-transpeptidase PbpA [Rugosimonospora acidiphila]|uniref:D,D-transpeptidase PbpA n=1 Tax=Rugosimonospora acidiphila TaxID=556531 RepID=A0ABP9RFN6_9ACTN